MLKKPAHGGKKLMIVILLHGKKDRGTSLPSGKKISAAKNSGLKKG